VRLVVRGAAEQDIAEAARWYEERSPGLGGEFLRAVDVTLAEIAHMPERFPVVRHALWSSGLRGYRLHRKDVPGKPDVAFPGRRVAVFVDGAWWHGHPDKWWPGRSGDYWDRKGQGNMHRDRRVDEELDSTGWAVVGLWDFEVLADPEGCCNKVASALGAGAKRGRHGGASHSRTMPAEEIRRIGGESRA